MSTYVGVAFIVTINYFTFYVLYPKSKVSGITKLYRKMGK